MGTLILAAILFLSGLWVAWQRFYPLTSAFLSGYDIVVPPSFYGAVVRDLVTCTTAFLGAFGLLLGRPFGWWLSMFQGYWRLSIQGILPLLGTIAAHTSTVAPSPSNKVPAALTASCVFLLIVLYLQKKTVRSYLHVTVRRAIVNVVLLVLGVVIAFSLDIWCATTLR
jgi:hypothetical protein